MNAAFTHISINGTRRSLSDSIQFLEGMSAEDQVWVQHISTSLIELQRGELSVSTSGTTGEAKQLKFTAEELIASAKITGSTFGLQAGERVLHCLPSKYIAGKMMIVRAIVLELDLCIVPPSGDLLPYLSGEYDFAAMIPLQIESLHQQNGIETHFKKIILGGGLVSPNLATNLREQSTAIWHTYGSTETCTHVAYRSISNNEATYRAVAGMHFESDSEGRLIIHTPHLLTTTHHTKDIVELIDEHSFAWLGRADNVVLSGGLKLYPEQLEQRCVNLVQGEFYFGKEKDDTLGEVLVMFLEVGEDGGDGEDGKDGEAGDSGNRSDSGETGKEETLLKALKRVLEKHEMPKRIYRVKRFERTETGKVKRVG